jgi:hypothetical protein
MDNNMDDMDNDNNNVDIDNGNDSDNEDSFSEESKADAFITRSLNQEKKERKARKADAYRNALKRHGKCRFRNRNSGKRTCERIAVSNDFCKNHARVRALEGLTGDERKRKQAEMRAKKLDRIRAQERGIFDRPVKRPATTFTGDIADRLADRLVLNALPSGPFTARHVSTSPT